MSDLQREQAQQRVNRIRAFEQELAALGVEGVLRLTDEQQRGVEAHHLQLLVHYRKQLDVDTDVASRQLSLGMRMASLFGALALVAALFFLVEQFWDDLSRWAKLAILFGSTLASLGLAAWLKGRDNTGYFTKLAALLAFSCFALSLTLLGPMFSLEPSDNLLLAWAAMALLLAYQCQHRLLLLLGLLCLVGFVSSRLGDWLGWYVWDVVDRPELFMPGAIVALGAGFSINQRYYGFAALYRLAGALCVMVPVLMLSFWGRASYLPWSAYTVEVLYQCAGFLFAGLLITVGIRRDWREIRICGVVFGVLLLGAKVFDWFWDVLPAYLFFLLVGLIALGVLLILYRRRLHSQQGA